MTDRTRARALEHESIRGGDAVVPWADLVPNPFVAEWLEREAPPPGRALDVGTGLGDTAEELVHRGFEVVAPSGQMPWPLTRGEVEAIADEDLHLVSLEDFMDREEPPVRRLRAVFRRVR